MKKISVLGSTGSIGVNTLEIVSRMAADFAVVGLAAGSNIPFLHEQVRRFNPKIVSLKTRAEADRLRSDLGGLPIRVVHGPEGAEEVARFEENDVVIAAITGIEGLRPTVAAVETGVRVALANKETMVVAGAILQSRAASSGAEIIPVDSEHSGIFQCLAKERKEDIRRAILTASGGPFFRAPLAEIKDKTVEEALAHPRWKMGRKVTVDSATLMNKGLELIEARWFFGLEPSQLDILIHPQSIVHSLVEMRDGVHARSAERYRYEGRDPVRSDLSGEAGLGNFIPRVEPGPVTRVLRGGEGALPDSRLRQAGPGDREESSRGAQRRQ
jgi:1-deoxy-D-xylulose-5-phosphate reductoisomerase